ncbi:hypothetical protein AB0D46_01505 [Streptomyces sp. NPDC048383]|uniref:hypothetical protein n=1 Tax=Streptomyces sp. NPDC048383 TaxID=3155386 RepID=UPI00343AFA02
MRRSTRLTRYAVPAVLCTALLAASPGLATAADAPARPPVAAPAEAGSKAIPDAEALLAQVRQLGSIGGVLQPVTDLLGAVLASPDGKLPEADVAAFRSKTDTALATLRNNLPPTPTAPAPPVTTPQVPAAAPKLPADAPKVPADAPKLPVAAPQLPADAAKLPAAAPQVPADAPRLPVAAPKGPAVPARAFAGPLDVMTAAIDNLKESVDGLLRTAGPCGCTTDAKAKATDVLTSLVATLVALLTGLGLPGLPPLPVPVPVP